MDKQLELIHKIADKNLTYNKDINQHIESCRISIQIINQKEDTIKILRKMLARKDEKIREIEENNLELRKENLVIEGRKDVQIKELREVLEEQYKLIEELIAKIRKS